MLKRTPAMAVLLVGMLLALADVAVAQSAQDDARAQRRPTA